MDTGEPARDLYHRHYRLEGLPSGVGVHILDLALPAGKREGLFFRSHPSSPSRTQQGFSMRNVNIGIIGFGTVGAGVVAKIIE